MKVKIKEFTEEENKRIQDTIDKAARIRKAEKLREWYKTLLKERRAKLNCNDCIHLWKYDYIYDVEEIISHKVCLLAASIGGFPEIADITKCNKKKENKIEL